MEKLQPKKLQQQVLSVKFKTFKSAGNLNNEIGLPLNLLELSNEYKAGVFELGANDFGEIKLLADILTPQIAVITNIGNTHLELLKDINGVGKLKWELIDSLGEGSFAILNFDDLVLQEKLRQCEKGELECKYKFLTYGLVEENKPLPKNCGFSEKADVWATDIKLLV